MLLRSARGCTLTPESYEENRYTPPGEEMISAATPAQSTLSFMCVWPPTSCHMVSNNSLSLSLARSLTNNRTSLSDSCSLIALCNLPLTTVSLSLALFLTLSL